MSSQITATSALINTAYPIAGQSNDTQGFRNNFTYIQLALTTASNEITNLQNSLSTSSAFTATIVNAVTATVWAGISSFVSTSTTYAIAAPTTSKGSPSDVKGMVFANTASIYVCYKTWANDNSDIWAKVNTVSQSW
jgi:hypothetical protein